MPQFAQGASAGAEYTAGVTVDEVQLGQEAQEEQLEQAEPQDEQAVPQTGRSTTWRISVTGRAHVVHALQGLQELQELQGLHDEQLEHAGAYDAHVEQPDETAYVAGA